MIRFPPLAHIASRVFARGAGRFRLFFIGLVLRQSYRETERLIRMHGDAQRLIEIEYMYQAKLERLVYLIKKGN